MMCPILCAGHGSVNLRCCWPSFEALSHYLKARAKIWHIKELALPASLAFVGDAGCAVVIAELVWFHSSLQDWCWYIHHCRVGVGTVITAEMMRVHCRSGVGYLPDVVLIAGWVCVQGWCLVSALDT